MNKLILIIICPLLLFGCKDEFLLESGSYKPVVVVEGVITNDPMPYIVALSLSSPVTENEKIPLINWTVTLFEDSISEILDEIEPGIYKTSENRIIGTVGKYYHITIQSPNGNIYSSEPQQMKPPVEIESVYAILTNRENLDYVFGLPGYQFYVNTELAENQNNFLLWQIEETYQYTSIHELFAIFDGHDLRTADYDLYNEYTSKYRCWKTHNVKNIYTGKTDNLVSPKINDLPLHFVGTDSRRLQERYSILVKQYSINEQSYYFWKNIQNQIEEDNILFATQPYNIPGNIVNMNNPEEMVYGNFTVASVTEKRLFVDAPVVPFYYVTYCSTIEDYSKVVPPVFIVVVEKEDENSELGAVHQACIDCTYYGGSNSKPDFWIDK
ncbi:MAG: DUF4249 domain-containing protein [Bacteroidetes bacterium]|nr:DUF4249 domain-containing protein [Bacteroidota bacterium]